MYEKAEAESPAEEAAERIKQLDQKNAVYLNEIVRAFCKAVKE